MEKIVRIFKSHAEADAVDEAFYKSLTSQERMKIMGELLNRGKHDSEQKLERVCRIVKREKG